jgi:hypothetical protein
MSGECHHILRKVDKIAGRNVAALVERRRIERRRSIVLKSPKKLTAFWRPEPIPQ